MAQLKFEGKANDPEAIFVGTGGHHILMSKADGIVTVTTTHGGNKTAQVVGHDEPFGLYRANIASAATIRTCSCAWLKNLPRRLSSTTG